MLPVKLEHLSAVQAVDFLAGEGKRQVKRDADTAEQTHFADADIAGLAVRAGE